MSNKIYSRIDEIPKGDASDTITEGCVVIEGGAFRGLYAQGVLDALMVNGINMSCTIGVSAGAMSGLSYVSGQIGRSIRINLNHRHDPKYVAGLETIKNNKGIIGFDFIFGEEVDKEEPFNYERFNDPRRKFIAVATNCNTGKEEYFSKDRCSDIYKAVQASASMPYVSQMVEIDGQPYLDGGCACKIAYKWPIAQEYKKIIVIRTRDEEYRKKESDLLDPITKTMYKNYPAFEKALENMNAQYNQACREIEYFTEKGRIFTIAPSQVVDIGRLEPDVEKLGDLYWEGYNDTLHHLDALKEYLEK